MAISAVTSNGEQFDLYQKNEKNRELNKDASQNSVLEQVIIVQTQGAQECLPVPPLLGRASYAQECLSTPSVLERASYVQECLSTPSVLERASYVQECLPVPPLLGRASYAQECLPIPSLRRKCSQQPAKYFTDEKEDIRIMLTSLEITESGTIGMRWRYENREILYSPQAKIIQKSSEFRKMAIALNRETLLDLLDRNVELINRER